MKANKFCLLLILLLPLSAFSQGMPGIICSGGAINCFIPGATVTGSGTSQVVGLPGSLTIATQLGLASGSAAAPAIYFTAQPTTGFDYTGTQVTAVVSGSEVFTANGNGPSLKSSGGYYFSSNASTSAGSLDLGLRRINSTTFGFSTDGSNVSDNAASLGNITNRLLGVSSTSFHSGATAMTFSTSSGDVVALTLGLDKTATFTGNMTGTGLLTSTGLSTTYLCVDSAGKFINDAAACIISAAKFKENVTSLNSKDALALVLGMRPVNYDLKDHAFDGWKNQFGFIADEAAKLRPELATYDEEGNVHGFRYEQYTAYLTGAIQQLNARIEVLEKR